MYRTASKCSTNDEIRQGYSSAAHEPVWQAQVLSSVPGIKKRKQWWARILRVINSNVSFTTINFYHLFCISTCLLYIMFALLVQISYMHLTQLNSFSHLLFHRHTPPSISLNIHSIFITPVKIAYTLEILCSHLKFYFSESHPRDNHYSTMHVTYKYTT